MAAPAESITKIPSAHNDEVSSSGQHFGCPFDYFCHGHQTTESVEMTLSSSLSPQVMRVLEITGENRNHNYRKKPDRVKISAIERENS